MASYAAGQLLTRSQFAAAIGADEKWVENTARTLGRRLAYTPGEARRMGLVRLIAREFSIPVTRAAELADDASRQPPDVRALQLATSTDSTVVLTIDLARYHSAFAAALSAALNHGGPRRRGRRPPHKPPRGNSAVAVAEAYGVDVSLLREALARSPGDRLARLDANATFLRALRPVQAAPASRPRTGRRR